MRGEVLVQPNIPITYELEGVEMDFDSENKDHWILIKKWFRDIKKT